MKKVMLFLLSLVVTSASFATSNEPHKSATPQSRLVMTTDYKLKLFVEPLASKGKLTIQDANGQSVYGNTVTLQKGLKQQFDISNLATGTYRLTLGTDSQTLTKTFVIQASPNQSFVVQ